MRGLAYQLVQEYCGEISSEGYAKVFNVTRKEILHYLRSTYKLGALVRFRTSNEDGFYAIPIGGVFRVFEQYGRVSTDPQEVSGEESVWQLFVDYVVRTSGTGLSFD